MAIEAYEAYVAKSGTSIIVVYRDTSTLKDVTLAAGSGIATISINGGAPITLATQRVNQAIVWMPSLSGQSFTILAGDSVTISAPSGWVTANSGADLSPALSGLALTNRTGVEHISIQSSSGTFRLGYNIQKPSYFNPVSMYNNVVRHANRFINTSSTYNSDGYPTALAGGAVEALLYSYSSSGEPWDAMPASGTWRIMWDGASGDCTLGASGSNTTVTLTASSTGNPTNNYRDYSVTVSPLPGSLKYTVVAIPTSNIRIYPPGVTGSSGKWRSEFLTQLGSPAALRFLDALDTNMSNVVNFSDFSPDTFLTYFRKQDQRSTAVVSFEAWTNDGTLYSTDRILVKCTTASPHGFVDGMIIDFSGATALACNSGAFTITPVSNYMIKALSATEFSFMHFRTGGGTVDAPVSPPSCTCLVDIAGTLPIADVVELCNLKSADLWINVPHAATDACVTALASYIAANLNSGLRCIAEYSNEHWNSGAGFQQFWYFFMRGQMDAAIVAATANVFYRGNYWYAQRTTEVHTLFTSAWNSAGRPTSTLVRLLATQYGNVQVTRNVTYWAITVLGKTVDAVGFAPYWGSDFVSADSTLTDQCSIDQLMEHAIAKLQHDARQDVTRYEAQVAELVPYGLDDSMYIYETGADIFAAGATPGSEKSRAVGRHPRMRQAWNWRLKKFETQGFKWGCVYLHGNLNLTSGGGGTLNTNWSVFIGYDQVIGLGDGSDGLFDNRTDYDNHGSVVSVQGYALNEWMTSSVVSAGYAVGFNGPEASNYGSQIGSGDYIWSFLAAPQAVIVDPGDTNLASIGYTQTLVGAGARHTGLSSSGARRTSLAKRGS